MAVSFQMLNHLVQNQVMSKEAGLRVLQRQQELFKEAGVSEFFKAFKKGLKGGKPPVRKKRTTEYDAKLETRHDYTDPENPTIITHTEKQYPTRVIEEDLSDPYTTPEILGRATRLLGIGGGLTGAALATSAGVDKYKAHQLNNKQEEAYTAMMRTNPDLRAMDQGVVRGHFESLKRYAPTVATDPFTSAKFLQQNIAESSPRSSSGMPMPGVDPQKARELVMLENTIQQSQQGDREPIARLLSGVANIFGG